jgi:hypothetical protein
LRNPYILWLFGMQEKLTYRDDHIKGTSHRKVKCDLLQVVCRHN